MDASTRSTHSNAFMYGFWKNKRIVLFDTLIKQPHDEIVAIMAHELGHWRYSHMIKVFAISAIQLLAYLAIFKHVISVKQAYYSFGFKTLNVCTGMFIFSLLLRPVRTNEPLSTIFLAQISMVIGILMTLLSRYHEFQADRFALDLGHGPNLQKALISLGIENKSAYNIDPW